MRFKAIFLYKPSNFKMDDCQIEKVVELSREEFWSLKTAAREEQPFISENKDCMFSKDDVMHCLLALGKEGRDGILVQSSGFDDPRYAAYIPRMRDILNAEMERAADFILRQCAENKGAGSWQAQFNNRPACGSCSVPFEELERHLGLTIREGNGLDAMLLDALRRRPEVSAAELSDGCVSSDYDLSPQKDTAARKKKLSAPFTTKRKVQIFENAISTVCEIFDYDDLYNMLHNSFGLTLQEIRAHNYMSDREIAETCGVPEELLDCDMTVRDVLQMEGVSSSAVLTCDGFDHLVPLEGLKRLAADDQKEIAALLDARVADIRVDDDPELVLEGVDAAELERLCDVLEAQTQTGQAMGPTMG